jgi:hypothetical protein
MAPFYGHVSMRKLRIKTVDGMGAIFQTKSIKSINASLGVNVNC